MPAVLVIFKIIYNPIYDILYIMYYILHSRYYILYIMNYILYAIYYILYSEYDIIYIYIIYYISYVISYILYIIKYKPPLGQLRWGISAFASPQQLTSPPVLLQLHWYTWLINHNYASRNEFDHKFDRFHIQMFAIVFATILNCLCKSFSHKLKNCKNWNSIY